MTNHRFSTLILGGIMGESKATFGIIQRAPTSSSYVIAVYLRFIFTIRDIRDIPQSRFYQPGLPQGAG